MTLRPIVLSILLVVSPTVVAPQGLTYTVPIFTLDGRALDAQRRAYHHEGARTEVLYCVEEWTTAPGPGFETRTVIKRIRRAHRGERHRISGIEAPCRDANGVVLPTIHTHSDGNCQFSPADLNTIAARRAAFDGVQCGERHFIWTSWLQIIAISVGGDLLRAERVGAVVPQ